MAHLRTLGHASGRTLTSRSDDDRLHAVELAVDVAQLRKLAAALDREDRRSYDGKEAQESLLATVAKREPRWTTWTNELRDRVARFGFVWVRGVPVESDVILIALGATLGVVTREGNGDPGELVYDVTPRPGGVAGSFSERRDPFPLHTDSVPAERPHGWVGLGCLIAAEGQGGESLLLPASEIVAALLRRGLEDAVDALADPVFPVPLPSNDRRGRLARIAILENPHGTPGIRFRDDHLVAGGLEEPSALDERHARALTVLREVLARDVRPFRILLRPGDLLLLDNRRMLHGRTAIAPTAQRVLRRLKIDARGLRS